MYVTPPIVTDGIVVVVIIERIVVVVEGGCAFEDEIVVVGCRSDDALFGDISFDSVTGSLTLKLGCLSIVFELDKAITIETAANTPTPIKP